MCVCLKPGFISDHLIKRFKIDVIWHVLILAFWRAHAWQHCIKRALNMMTLSLSPVIGLSRSHLSTSPIAWLQDGVLSRVSLIQPTSQQHSAAEILPSPFDHVAHTDKVGFPPALPSSKASHCLSSAVALPRLCVLASDNNYVWIIILVCQCSRSA